MNSTELRRAFDTVLRSKTVCDGLRDAGKSRGSGFYIRWYIMSWMIANADRLESVEDTARRTGCTREQVQLVWDCLHERGAFGDDDCGDISIETMMQSFAARASDTVSRDYIAGMISLTPDEAADLKKRLGDRYQMCYHLAAEYKARLRREKKQVFITDWMLIQKAYDENWQPSYMSKTTKAKSAKVEEEEEDDGIITMYVDGDDADNEDDEDWDEEDDDPQTVTF